MSVEGIDDVKKALEAAAKKYSDQSQVAVVVGYNAKYALALHENVEMKWRGLPRDRSVRKDKDKALTVVTGYSPAKGKHGVFWGPTGQAKFLEQPARELGPELGRMITTAVKNGAKLLQALVMAGMRLQRESQKIVPVEFGNLKGSAFTEEDTGKTSVVVGTVK